MAEETRGRPTMRTPEMIDEIIQRIADGETLTDVCSDDHMPSRVTVYDWADKDKVFSLRLSHAREIGYDAMADELRNTARGIGESSGDVARDKLIIDTDVRLLARWSPKRYGDRQIVSGDKDADPVQVEAKTDYSRLSVDELRTLMALAEKAAIARD